MSANVFHLNQGLLIFCQMISFKEMKKAMAPSNKTTQNTAIKTI